MPKTLTAILSLLMLMLIGASAPSDVQARSSAQAAEMAAFFHDDLAPYGRWIEHRVYGTVWVPDSGRPDWHPYWDGRWVWTTDYGWYWHSYEPYGWATYHYGRWVLTSDYGWVWVPDNTWGPAWVEWRYGSGYAGWTPMPPPQQENKRTVGAAGTWIFAPQGELGRAGMQRAADVQTAELLTATSITTGANLAATLRVKAEPISSVGSAAEQAAARAKGQVAIYRLPLLSGFNPATPGGLNLDVPLDTATEFDPATTTKAKAKFDDSVLPDKPVGGSVESTMGGTFGDADRNMRAPSSGGSGGIGVNIPGAGGVRLGR